MTSGRRLLLAIICGVVLLASATLGAAAWLVYGPGAVCVEVHQRSGSNVAIRVPAVVARLAVGMIPAGAFREGGDELREALPMLRGACEALDHVEDAVLVEVDRPGEHVRIEKKGSRLLISAESDEESVRLEVPLATIRWIADRIERDLRPSSGPDRV